MNLALNSFGDNVFDLPCAAHSMIRCSKDLSKIENIKEKLDLTSYTISYYYYENGENKTIDIDEERYHQILERNTFVGTLNETKSFLN
jgi:hypothetical protein